jgi:hypothetical protein
MTDTTVNSAGNSAKRKMPKGKPFVKDDPRINRAGAPKRGQSWQETVKRITDMTREELIEYLGPSTKLGKQMRELPSNIPLKDALVVASIIAYGRDPNPRLLATLMDREEGKPNQPIEIKDEMTDAERVTKLTALLDAARARRDGQSTNQ